MDIVTTNRLAHRITKLTGMMDIKSHITSGTHHPNPLTALHLSFSGWMDGTLGLCPWPLTSIQCNRSILHTSGENRHEDFLTAFFPLAMAMAAAVAESLPSTKVVVCAERMDPRVWSCSSDNATKS